MSIDATIVAEEAMASQLKEMAVVFLDGMHVEYTLKARRHDFCLYEPQKT